MDALPQLQELKRKLDHTQQQDGPFPPLDTEGVYAVVCQGLDSADLTSPSIPLAIECLLCLVQGKACRFPRAALGDGSVHTDIVLQLSTLFASVVGACMSTHADDLCPTSKQQLTLQSIADIISGLLKQNQERPYPQGILGVVGLLKSLLVSVFSKDAESPHGANTDLSWDFWVGLCETARDLLSGVVRNCLRQNQQFEGVAGNPEVKMDLCLCIAITVEGCLSLSQSMTCHTKKRYHKLVNTICKGGLTCLEKCKSLQISHGSLVRVSLLANEFLQFKHANARLPRPPPQRKCVLRSSMLSTQSLSQRFLLELVDCVSYRLECWKSAVLDLEESNRTDEEERVTNFGAQCKLCTKTLQYFIIKIRDFFQIYTDNAGTICDDDLCSSFHVLVETLASVCGVRVGPEGTIGTSFLRHTDPTITVDRVHVTSYVAQLRADTYQPVCEAFTMCLQFSAKIGHGATLLQCLWGDAGVTAALGLTTTTNNRHGYRPGAQQHVLHASGQNKYGKFLLLAWVLKHHKTMVNAELGAQLPQGLEFVAESLDVYYSDFFENASPSLPNGNMEPGCLIWPDLYQGWKSFVSTTLTGAGVPDLQLMLLKITLRSTGASCGLSEELCLGLWRAASLRWGASFVDGSVHLAVQLVSHVQAGGPMAGCAVAASDHVLGGLGRVIAALLQVGAIPCIRFLGTRTSPVCHSVFLSCASCLPSCLVCHRAHARTHCSFPIATPNQVQSTRSGTSKDNDPGLSVLNLVVPKPEALVSQSFGVGGGPSLPAAIAILKSVEWSDWNAQCQSALQNCADKYLDSLQKNIHAQSRKSVAQSHQQQQRQESSANTQALLRICMMLNALANPRFFEVWGTKSVLGFMNLMGAVIRKNASSLELCHDALCLRLVQVCLRNCNAVLASSQCEFRLTHSFLGVLSDLAHSLTTSLKNSTQAIQVIANTQDLLASVCLSVSAILMSPAFASSSARDWPELCLNLLQTVVNRVQSVPADREESHPGTLCGNAMLGLACKSALGTLSHQSDNVNQYVQQAAQQDIGTLESYMKLISITAEIAVQKNENQDEMGHLMKLKTFDRWQQPAEICDVEVAAHLSVMLG
jgi:hypothetical protein